MKTRKSARLRRGLTLTEMAVTLSVLGFLIMLLTSIINDIPYLKSTQGEAELLKSVMNACRSAALKSNQVVILEFDLDENTYRAFRYMRAEGKLVEKNFVKKRTLSRSNSLAGIRVSGGEKRTEGKVRLEYRPEGGAEEIAVYLGPGSEQIQKTVLQSRYGIDVSILEGVAASGYEDNEWKEDLEKR